VLNQAPLYEDVWGNGGIAPGNFNLGDRGGWSASGPGRFILRKTFPGPHWIEGWVSIRTRLDAVVKRSKSLTLPGIEPRPSNLPEIYRDFLVFPENASIVPSHSL